MITLEEQITEAKRELALRKQCYPGWIKRGKLDAGEAAYQMRCLEAIVRTLALVDFAQRQLPLFPTPAAPGVPAPAPAPSADACPYCGRLGNGEPCAPACGA